MNHVQVAVHVLEDDSGKLKRERAAQDRRITQLRKQISQGSNLTDETGLSEDTLALQLNRNLDARVWNGTRFTDRAAHLSGGLGKLITNELEKSLLAQETYEAFEARMLGKLGVTNIAEPLGPLRDMDNMLRSEAKIAWNEGMLTANQSESDTALVWRCQLKPTSTAECVRNHGMLIDDVGYTPLAHHGCGCDVISCPDSESDDPAIAAAGQAFLAAMAAEREAHEQQYGDVMQEAEPSRFAFIRAAQEAETAPTLLHPAVIRSAESFAKKRSTRAAKPWGRWGGDVVDGAHAAGQATVQ